MDKMVIGEFCESFPPLMDGVGNVMKNYTEEMIKRGHEARTITTGNREAAEYDRAHAISYTIRCRMFPLPGLKPYGLVIEDIPFKKKLNAIDFDLVHAHSPFVLGNLAKQIAEKKHIPMVATFHTQFREDILGIVKSENIADGITNLVLKHYQAADQVWTPSDWSRQKLYEYGFKGKVTVVENACDMDTPTPTEHERYRNEGLALANVSFPMPMFLYVGQHKDEKNIRFTLNALLLLKQKGIPYRMVFVGEGANKQSYEEFVQEHDLAQQILFLGKITDREKLKALYAAATLFLFPSKYDISAVVMREAAAFNLPLIFLAGSCTAGPIIDGKNGFLTNDDEQEYARKIEWIIRHPQAIETAGAGAHHTLYRHWRDAADEVEQRYRELIDSFKKNYHEF
ncbi:MAG: glycosyltransferase [Sphaerochaetaceae bacterium]|jgi:glycosyltransferase involved in cell wall biosynthesis|nr:glycosyltransferase [Sphaerochaetaceae bacterium]NLO59617.1 glycosyltransferase family 4 protein [Spirochaetales bacterium]MDD2406006.1 glycosyltransferase [Sphaerochaetaceae bacterium]MDD3670370.1 glycosyltransferase [Sphaerochaetaceae bacterium]MDD4259251.1 glycosyltransferase [Sphaerochaetaceae bacterium]